MVSVAEQDRDQMGSHSRTPAPDPPNLTGTLMERAKPKLQLDLKTLDSFHSPSDKDDLSNKDDA